MKTEEILYKDGDKEFEGHFVRDPARGGKLPTVFIAHAWAGPSDFERNVAQKLARLGYGAFVADLYGKGIRGRSVEENARLMQPFMEDRSLLRRRMQVSLDAIRGHEAVDSSRMAAIGYCFGGSCVLDLARSGARVAGVVSFHGLLTPPGLADNPKQVSARILVLHGYEDPLAPPDHVTTFAREMTDAGADWQIHMYGHIYHAFTNPEVNDPKGLGAAYDAKADRRSWQAMENFLVEIFGS